MYIFLYLFISLGGGQRREDDDIRSQCSSVNCRTYVRSYLLHTHFFHVPRTFIRIHTRTSKSVMVQDCPECGCSNFVEHAFKKGYCQTCGHVHDPTMKKKKTPRRRKKKIELKKCATCGKTVYRAELLEALDKIYHETCFRCVSCDKRLTLITYKDHDNDPYCATCYGKTDGAAKGVGPGRVGTYKEGEKSTEEPKSHAVVKKAARKSLTRRVSSGSYTPKVAAKPKKGVDIDNACFVCGDCGSTSGCS